MKVGAVQVVRFLRHQFDAQQAPLHGDLE
jgi:hypothetical protein